MTDSTKYDDKRNYMKAIEQGIGRDGGGGGRERRRRKRGSKRKIHGGVAESRGIGGAKERRRSGERAMGIERVGR